MWDLLMKYLCPRDFRRGEMEENMNAKLKEISKRNIVAKEWIEHYYNLKKVLHNIKQTQTISKDDEDIFDDEVYRVCQFFENIQVNPGLRDWFKEFAEVQTEIFAALAHYYYKYKKDDTLVSIFIEGYKQLVQNEKELE